MFLHRPSRTLLVSDLLFNIETPANFITKVVLDMMGTRGRLAMSRAWRRYTKDRQALRESLQQVLAWDFGRILPGHGAVFENARAPELAREALSWALGGGTATS